MEKKTCYYETLNARTTKIASFYKDSDAKLNFIILLNGLRYKTSVVSKIWAVEKVCQIKRFLSGVCRIPSKFNYQILE